MNMGPDDLRNSYELYETRMILFVINKVIRKVAVTLIPNHNVICSFIFYENL